MEAGHNLPRPSRPITFHDASSASRGIPIRLFQFKTLPTKIGWRRFTPGLETQTAIRSLVRISLPTYLKDVEHLLTSPGSYLRSSFSSTLSKGMDLRADDGKAST